MYDRPKLKLELTFADKVLEVLGWLALIVVWIIPIINYPALPDIIPIHYNGLGEADGFGSKNYIWSLPIIATLLFVGLTLLNRIPHHFNYPKEITEENAEQQYYAATRLMRYIKFIIVVIFGMIVIPTVQFHEGNSSGLGAWFLPLSMALLFVPIIFSVIKMYKEPRNK